MTARKADNAPSHQPETSNEIQACTLACARDRRAGGGGGSARRGGVGGVVATAVRSAHGRCAACARHGQSPVPRWPLHQPGAGDADQHGGDRRLPRAAVLRRTRCASHRRHCPYWPSTRRRWRQRRRPAACARSGSAMPAPMWRSTGCACCWTRCSPSGCRRCPSARGAFMRRRSRWPTCPLSTPCSSRTTTTTIWTWTRCATWPSAARGSSCRWASAPISNVGACRPPRSRNWSGGSSARSGACKSCARPRATTRAATRATAVQPCGQAGR